MNIYEKLMHIQVEMKAPKNLFNSFGKYKYRNAEGILEAVKPYLDKYKCTLVINDKVELVGDRVFVRAESQLIDFEGDKPTSVISTAYAELGEHKGMSEDQVTGCASSYARKYCLNALFLLDDTKDADSDEYKTENEAKDININADLMGQIKVLMIKKGVDEPAICKRYKVDSLNELTMSQGYSVLKSLNASKDK